MPKTPRRMKIYHYTAGSEHHFTASRIFFTAEQLKQAMVVERKTKARETRKVLNRKPDSPISGSLTVPHYEVRVEHGKKMRFLMVRHAFPYPIIGGIYHPIRYARGFEPGGRGLGAVFHLGVMEKLMKQYPPNMEVRFWSPSDELLALLKKAGLVQTRNYTLQEHVNAFRELARKNAEKRTQKQ